MSRNERAEVEELFVLTVISSVKAKPPLRATVVREGMSVHEERVIKNTLQSDGMRILKGRTTKSS